MMIATDSNVKRTFQQMHDMLLAAVNPTVQPYALGAAISFITTTVILTQQLKTERRLPATVEDEQKKTVHDWMADGRLTVTQCVFINADNNDAFLANLRHLRNCFGHANWRYVESAISQNSMPITLEDYQPTSLQQTWAASIDMIALINLAQQLLVVTFNGMP